MLNSICSHHGCFSSSYTGIGVSVAALGLSYLAFCCLKGGQDAFVVKPYAKILVICPKSSSFGDQAFVKRIARIAREILPVDVNVVLQGRAQSENEELQESSPLEGIEIRDFALDFSKMSPKETEKMYIFHDNVSGLDQNSLFPRNHLINMTQNFQNSSSLDSQKYPIFCLQGEEVAQEFKNHFLKQYTSFLSQKAFFVVNPSTLLSNWGPICFFVSSALSAQKLPMLTLYLPGIDFLQKELFPTFIAELLHMISDHPNRPAKVHCIVSQEQAAFLQQPELCCPMEKENGFLEANGNHRISDVVFSIEGGISRRNLRIVFPGEISSKDLEKLQWINQTQTLGDTSFSQWLSYEPEVLNHLIEVSQEKNLNDIGDFLRNFRRDSCRDFSHEECENFASVWMDPKVQQEAQMLREIVQKEEVFVQWMRGNLPLLWNEA